GDEQVPYHRLKCLGVGRDRFRIDGRNDAYRIADLGRVAAVAPDDAENFRAAILRVVERAYQVRADILLEIAAAHGKYKDGVLGGQPRNPQPLAEDRIPAFVVGPRSELGHVVGRRVGFDARYLAEVIDRMGAVAGASADAEKKQPAAIGCRSRQEVRHAIDDVHVETV